jgi:hypothetical protein
MSRLFLTLVFLSLFYTSVTSRHLIGGNMEYVCLSANESGSYLRLKMVLIRDVSGGGADFDLDAWVGVYEKNDDGSYTYFTTIANISPLFVEDLDLSSYLPFSHFTTQVFQKGVYEMEVRLPSGSDYTLAYQRCCYTDDVTNILNSGENGLALTMDITAEALKNCDNSPVLPALPFLLAPIGVEINYPIAAFDPDEDGIEMVYGSFLVSGGTDGVTSGNPNACTGVRPNSQNCPPPYNSSLFLLPTYSSDNPFGSNDLDFMSETNSFTGMASISGRFAHAVELLQSDNDQILSVQNIQYTTTFVSGLGVGRMIAHPFVDLNTNGTRESEEPPFIGIQLDVEDAFLNQVLEDGSVVMKLDPGQYMVEPHLPEGWKVYNNQSISVSIEQPGNNYGVDIPVVHASSESPFLAHASLSQGWCDHPGLILLTIRNESASIQDLMIEMAHDELFTMMDHPEGIYTIEGNKLQAEISDLNPSSWTSLPIYVNNPALNQDAIVNVVISSETIDDTLQVNLQPVCGDAIASLTSPIKNVQSMDERIMGYLAFRNDNPGDVFMVRNKIKLNQYINFNSFRIESSTQPVSFIMDEDNRTIEVIMNDRAIPSTSSGSHDAGGMISYSLLPVSDITDGDILEIEVEVFMDNHMPISPEPLSIDVDLQNVSTSDLSYEISVHPNPFTSEIWIKGILETGRMMIYDVHGKVVHNAPIAKDQRLTLDQLTPGIYFYQFSTDVGQASGRLIKN